MKPAFEERDPFDSACDEVYWYKNRLDCGDEMAAVLIGQLLHTFEHSNLQAADLLKLVIWGHVARTETDEAHEGMPTDG